MKVIMATIVIFAAAMAAMAVGVIFKRRRLRGSCGGTPQQDTNHNTQTHDHCPCKTPEKDRP
ncbi:MAG: (Na+)-NQR maturation NqrM [Planctomycetota bacterium]|jgi:hypothetical protein